MAFLDGSFAPARQGGDKVGLTKKGQVTKWMLVIDGTGLPLGFHLASANSAEVKLAEQTLDTIGVPRPRGRPKQRPMKLVADRGYDSSALRRALRHRGIAMCIPPKRRPATWRAKRGRPVVARKEEYRQRYKVEIVHPQMTQPNGRTVAGGGEDVRISTSPSVTMTRSMRSSTSARRWSRSPCADRRGPGHKTS